MIIYNFIFCENLMQKIKPFALLKNNSNGFNYKNFYKDIFKFTVSQSAPKP